MYKSKRKTIIANIISPPYAKDQIVKDLNAARLNCLSVDTSDHIDLKSVPVIHILIQRIVS